MLKEMTTGFAAAIRVIAAENVNVLRSFISDVAGLLSRPGRLRKEGKTVWWKEADLKSGNDGEG